MRLSGEHLTSLVPDARQPRLAMLADGHADTKTRGIPLAIEHPEYGASFPTSWIPCCWAVAFNTLEWAWARETWRWLISITLFFIFVDEQSTRREHCRSHTITTTRNRRRLFFLFPCGIIELFTPTPVPALPLLQELLVLDVSCATGEVTLRYCTGEGGSVNVASALLALACAPGITLVARRDDPFLLQGNTRRPFSKWASVLFRMISCFSWTT